MKRNYFLLIFSLSLSFIFSTSFSQAITIGDLRTSSFCAGGTLEVPFTTNLPKGTAFQVFISDALGSFNSQLPVGEGTVSPITIKFPNNYGGIKASKTYRLRIISQNSLIISNASPDLSTNGQEFIISVKNLIGRDMGNTVLCEGSAVTGIIISDIEQTGVNYEWKKDNVIQVKEATLKITQEGSYVATIQKTGCGSSIKNIYVEVGKPAYYQTFRHGEEHQCEGGKIVFSNNYYSDSIKYQWFKNGIALLGMINDTLVATQTGTYTVKHTDKCPIVEGKYQPQYLKSVVFGNSIKNSILNSGDDNTRFLCGYGTSLSLGSSFVPSASPYFYQWQRNGINISNANKGILEKINLEGIYTLLLTQGKCKTTSEGINITRKDTIKLGMYISEPWINEICKEPKILLSFNNIPYELSLSLYKNGVVYKQYCGYDEFVNETGSYNLVGRVNIGGGNYGCTVLPSDTIRITLSNLLKFSVSNSYPDLCEGNVGSLYPELKYSNEYKFQWFKDNQPILGATSNIFDPIQTGFYKVSFSFGSCTGMSDSTKVTVGKTLLKPKFEQGTPNYFESCKNNVVTLLSNGNNQGFWSERDSLILKKNKVIVGIKSESPLNISESGTYTIMRKQGKCFSPESDPVTITFAVPVTANISGSASIFAGQKANINLNFTGGNTWFYQTSETATIQTSSFSSTIKSVYPTTSQTYFLTSVASNCGNGSVSGNANVNVATPLGIDLTKENDDFKVFPNPSQDYLEINVDGKIQVFDIKGNQVDVIQQGKSVKINNLIEGTYFLKVINNKGEVLTKKFIKINCK